MADETSMTRGAPVAAPGRGSRPIPGSAAADDPEIARAEIEATRARMSETIDEIEDALLRRKEDIREKLDVLAPVRERPLKTLGMIFGGALVLGLLTAGGKKERRDDREEWEDGGGRPSRRARIEVDEDAEEEDEAYAEEAALARQRAEDWEERAHRLLRIAKAQETELEIHRERQEKMRRQLRARPRVEEEDEYEDDGEPNLFERVRDSAAERLAVLAGEVSHRMMRGG